MITRTATVDAAGTERWAILSDDELHRYELGRVWNRALPLLYIGCLNPSKADATTDDHTVRKLTGFAMRWNLGGFVLWNLYAYRATDPRELGKRAPYEAVGPYNDSHLVRIFREADASPDARLVAAWGAHATWPRVNRVVGDLMPFGVLARLKCWGTTSNGMPLHPLRLGYDTALEPYLLRGVGTA